MEEPKQPKNKLDGEVKHPTEEVGEEIWAKEIRWHGLERLTPSSDSVLANLACYGNGNKPGGQAPPFWLGSHS